MISVKLIFLSTLNLLRFHFLKSILLNYFLFLNIQPDAIEMLVQAGADINAKTKNGETPYGKALFDNCN